MPFSLDNQSHLRSFHAKKKELRPESEEDHYLLLVEGGVLLTCVYRTFVPRGPPPPQPRKGTFFPTTYYQEVMSLPKNMQVLPIKTEL